MGRNLICHMKTIPEMHCVHLIRFLPIYFLLIAGCTTNNIISLFIMTNTFKIIHHLRNVPLKSKGTGGERFF